MSERKKRTETRARRPALNIRTTQQLRDQLEAAARLKSVSMSQEVISRLEATLPSDTADIRTIIREEIRAALEGATVFAYRDSPSETIKGFQNTLGAMTGCLGRAQSSVQTGIHGKAQNAAQSQIHDRSALNRKQ